MGYQPNVVSAGDIVFVEGVRFRVVYDFNIARGDKRLLLKKEDEPNIHIAKVERG